MARLAEVDRLDARVVRDRVGTSPSASSAPLTSTDMRVAKLNTRSMSCSISSTDTSAGSARACRGSPRDSPAGTPATGSSSSSTRGCAGERDGDLEQAALAVGELARPAGASRRPGGTARAASRSASSTRASRAQRRHQRAPTPARCATRERQRSRSGVSSSNSWLIWNVRTRPRAHAPVRRAARVMSSPSSSMRARASARARR